MDHKMETAMRFGIGYVLFITPLVVLLGLEFDDCVVRGIFPGQAQSLHSSMDMRFIAGCAIWLALLIGTYIAMPYFCDRYMIGRECRCRGQRTQDIVRLIYEGVSLGGLGGVIERIWTTPWFVAVIVGFLIAYTALFEIVRKRKITLTPGLLSNKSKWFGCTMVVTSCLVIAVALCSQLITAYRVGEEFFFAYLTSTITIGSVHIALLCFNKNFHVHHWYWSLILAHACVFDTPTSMVAQAMLLGIHIHGAACFGYEPIFPSADSLGK